jgi:hypothetical protein
VLQALKAWIFALVRSADSHLSLTDTRMHVAIAGDAHQIPRSFTSSAIREAGVP